MGNICFKSTVRTIQVTSSKSNGYNSKPRLSHNKPISRSSLPPPPQPPDPQPSTSSEPDRQRIPPPPNYPPPPLPSTPTPRNLMPIKKQESAAAKVDSNVERFNNQTGFVLTIQDAEDLTPAEPMPEPVRTTTNVQHVQHYDKPPIPVKPMLTKREHVQPAPINQDHVHSLQKKNESGQPLPARRAPVQLTSSTSQASPKPSRPATPAVSLPDHHSSKVSISNVSVRPGSLVSTPFTSSYDMSLEELDHEMDDDFTSLRPNLLEDERENQEVDIRDEGGSFFSSKQNEKSEMEREKVDENVHFRFTQDNDQLPSVTKDPSKTLPRDLFKHELERKRQKRKRRREQINRRMALETPRVAKPGDLVSDGFDFKRRPISGASVTSTTNSFSTDTFTFRNDSRGSGLYSFGSEKSEGSMTRESSNASLLSTSSSWIQDSLNNELSDLGKDLRPNEVLSFDDPLRDLNLPDDIQSGTSTSNNLNTKHKLLYSRYQRRPFSETMANSRLMGKPPLPPGALNKVRPVSETVLNRSTQNYSRHFAEENVLIDIN